MKYLIILIFLTSIFANQHQEIKGKCWNEKFIDVYCKLRTDDNKVYINGKWYDNFKLVNVEEYRGVLHFFLKDRK